MLESYEQCFQEYHENALFFIDPPYLNTKANYKSKGVDHGGLDAKELESKVNELKSDFIFTYGDGAAETFPSLAWQLATIRKVPNLRRGGTVDRKEFFAVRTQ